jgi:hypothetical protein
LALAVSTRASTSPGVRCSRVRSSAFGRLTGATVRFTSVGVTSLRCDFATENGPPRIATVRSSANYEQSAIAKARGESNCRVGRPAGLSKGHSSADHVRTRRKETSERWRGGGLPVLEGSATFTQPLTPRIGSPICNEAWRLGAVINVRRRWRRPCWLVPRHQMMRIDRGNHQQRRKAGCGVRSLFASSLWR